MSKQAVCLIDDAKFHISGIATSWDYDDRATRSLSTPFPDALVNPKTGKCIRFVRRFQAQASGVLTFEFLYTAEKSADGVYLQLLSSEKKPLVTLRTQNGRFVFNGVVCQMTAELGAVCGKITVDLDAATAVLILDGRFAAKVSLQAQADAAFAEIGTDGSTDVIVRPKKFRLTRDYLAHETFLCTASAFPPPWQVDGGFEIRKHTASNPQMDYTYAAIDAKGGSLHRAYLPFSRAANGDLLCEGYFLLPTGDDGLAFSLEAGDTQVFGVHTKENAFYTADGRFLRRFTPNVWQCIRLETDAAEGHITVKIDGKVCGTFPFCFADAPEKPDGVCITFAPKTDGTLCFADIVCEEACAKPDYCPEPEAVRHPEYEVGINVCNMWREGHHFGWDRITYFEANTPLIGPYDEGNPEVADWEIKFMTEHGITFEHFCWYCPDPLINFPIKRSRMDAALRDGFMNARYSDKMKFIIMWENNTYSNTDPEAFKEYVWKYWCEYFFTDKRYLVIDNKPLLSLWSFNFVKHWGGEEKAHEIIAFMNEDIKKYGFDGILLMATAMGGAERYKEMSKYCDVSYAYHFGSGAYDPDSQMASIDQINGYHDKDGQMPFVQTASVGFNACPWHGAEARVPLITPENFEKVLRYIKKRNDDVPASEKTWHQKLFMMATWNEYGEGTYIMPAGVHGFGYLDAIRAVFVPERGKCDNLLPQGEALDRLCRLRVKDRVMIRRLGYEPSEEEQAANTLVNVFDFSKACAENELWEPYNAAAEFMCTGTHKTLAPTAITHEHYSIRTTPERFNEKAACFSHIRVRLRSPEKNAAIRIAFLTDTEKRWASNKCTGAQKIEASETFADYTFCMSTMKTWCGDITDLRIDNMVRTPVEIAEIAFMTYTEPAGGDPTVYVGGEKLRLAFRPYFAEDGQLMVSLDPGYAAFRALKLYHEYDRKNARLTVESDRATAVFTIGENTYLLDGNEKMLTHAPAMRDGLPTFALEELCAVFGIPYHYDGKHFMIE